MRLTVQEIRDCVPNVAYVDKDAASRVVEGFTWDSRKVEKGNLFVAMPGERVDGNDFITKAIWAGAGAVMCTRQPSESLRAVAGEFSCPLIVVEDAQLALSALAAYWRAAKLHALVIGVTGSTGKTSTKDLLKNVLSQRYKVHATSGNHNNELGVPLTILTASEDTDILIVEMGMRGLGQIEALCQIAQPSIGVVSNVGVCHMELLGSRLNIARAKGELIAALPPTGLAVVNSDDDMTEFMLGEAQALDRGVRVCRFGSGDRTFTHVSNVVFDANACAEFDLGLGIKEDFHVRVAMPGRHNMSNALSAVCVADHLGLTPEEIQAGLAVASSSGMRMETVRTESGVCFINDAYNANPDSMAAGLETLASMECEGRRIAILGDMGELGADEAQMHYRVGEKAARCSLDLLVCVGELSVNTAQGALDGGMAAKRVVCAPDVDSAIEIAEQQLAAGDLVLVKASRFMGMERIVKELSE